MAEARTGPIAPVTQQTPAGPDVPRPPNTPAAAHPPAAPAAQPTPGTPQAQQPTATPAARQTPATPLVQQARNADEADRGGPRTGAGRPADEAVIRSRTPNDGSATSLPAAAPPTGVPGPPRAPAAGPPRPTGDVSVRPAGPEPLGDHTGGTDPGRTVGWAVPGRARRPGARRTGLLLAVLVLAVLAGAAWALLAGLGGAPPVSGAEGAFAVRAFAINRFGFAAAHLPWYDGGAGALQVAAYETVSGALSRAGSAVVAAREAMVLATALGGVALAVAARRLQLSVPATVVATLLYGFAPLALLLHRTADPTNLGVMWACAGFAVAAGGARRVGTSIVAAGYLALGVLSAPVVLVVVLPLAAGLLVTGDVGRLPRWARVVAGALGLAGYIALVTLAAHGQLGGVDATAELPATSGLDQVLIVAAALAAVAALAVRWLRPLAIGLVALGLAAAIATEARPQLAILAVPLAAVLLPALADVGTQRSRAWLAARPGPQAGRQRSARLVPAAVATGVVLALAIGWVPAAGAVRSGAPVDRSLDQARDWVLASLPTRPRLAVDDALWAKLIDAGYPAEQLVAGGGLGLPSPTSRPGWADCVFVLGRDTELLRLDPADPVRMARDSSAIVAGWGIGADRVNARRVLIDRATALTQAVRDARSRAEAGAALSRNPQLTVDPEAVTLLRRGDVDARIIAVLATISGQHRLRIATFPPVDGEDDRLPRRQIAVTVIDGQQVAPGATNAMLLDQWLKAQQPPYRPATTAITTVLTRSALLISYDAVSQPGLLPP